MRLGIISDIHGNHSALRAALQLLANQNSDKIVCAGDLAGYNSRIPEVIETLLTHNVECITGNHDFMLTRQLWQHSGDPVRTSLAHGREALSPALLAWLHALPEQREWVLDGHRVVMVHGMPDDPINGDLYPQMVAGLELEDSADILIVGHTHLPFAACSATGTLVVNPGSCGLPRDGDPRLSCALLDTTTLEVTHYRALYDFSETSACNRADGLPFPLDSYLMTGGRMEEEAALDGRITTLMEKVATRLAEEGQEVLPHPNGLVAQFDCADRASAVVTMVSLAQSADTVLMRTSPLFYRWQQPANWSPALPDGITPVTNAAAVCLQSRVAGEEGLSADALYRTCLTLQTTFCHLHEELS
jgi:putative phosphoesterase